MSETITAVAALAAALFSVTNVFISGRLSRRGQIQQWRRDTGRRLMSEVLTTTRELGEHWHAYARAMAKQLEPDPGSQPTSTNDDRAQAADQQESLRGEIAKSTESLEFLADELELITSPKTVACSRTILATYRQRMAVSLRPGGPNDKVSQYWGAMEVVESARADFVRACRIDLGIERAASSYWFQLRRHG